MALSARSMHVWHATSGRTVALRHPHVLSCAHVAVGIPPGGAVARPFNIDPAQASELEVADRIWSLIELAHTPPAAVDTATH